MNIAEAVKQCALSSYEAKIPCDVFFGKITSAEPYRAEINSMTIEGDLLVVPEGMKERRCEIRIAGYEREIVVNEGLKAGDGAVFLRKCGGSAYIVIGRLGGE